MSPEIQAKMNDLCFKMNEAADEFKLDPSTDAQFCAGTISQAIAGMNMRLGNQWGKTMRPVATDVATEGNVATCEKKESSVSAAPKKSSKTGQQKPSARK